MKRIVLIIALIVAGTSAWAQDDTVSEATVAAPQFDPSKPECNCLGSVAADLPLQNDRADKQVVNWIVDPSAPGPAPTLGDSTVAH